MLDPEIRALMNQVVRWAKPLGRTDHGDTIYGQPTETLLARVEPRVEFVRTGSDGEDVSSSHVVLCATRLPAHAKLWPPGADLTDGEQGRTVKSIAPMADEDGTVSHYEVLI